MLVLTGLLHSGCGKEDSIVTQKAPVPARPPAKDALLAAIVPVGQKAWFFKMSGPKAAVAAEQNRFRSLVLGLKVEGDTPKWETPSAWEELEGGSSMREATFLIGDKESRLECTVIPLPTEDDPKSDEYTLANVNRWRGQIGLEKLSLEQMTAAIKGDGEVERQELSDGTPVTLVNLSGNLTSGGPPFAGMAGMGAPQRGTSAGRPAQGPRGPTVGPPTGETASGSGGIDELNFVVPEGWNRGPLKPLRRISWIIGAGEEKAEAYISTLGAGGSAVAPNVARWRTQAGLPALSGAELDKTIEKIAIGGEPGVLVELIGEKRAILGAIVVKGDTGWFLKLDGHPTIAEQQKANFRSFIESIEFK